VAAAWREDGKTLTLSIVNPTHEVQTLALGVTGAAFTPAARLWRMTGSDEKAYNEPGQPPAVSFAETKGERVPANGPLAVPPMSISLYELVAAKR
jgi:alpha-L-arabinofuranosidase